jgi:small conductance mechanosensitive channel
MILLFTDRLESMASWFSQNGWQKLQKFALVLITCALILWAMRLVRKTLTRSVGAALQDANPDAVRRARTVGSVLENFARVLVISFFILETLQEFNVNVGPLVAGLGIAGAALGFGAQSLVKDVIGGFFLLVENQFAVGDIVALDDKHIGVVERMTLRVTMLRDLEGRAHYVPNGNISGVVVMSKEFAKAMVDVEVSLDEDVERVIAVLRELGAELPGSMANVLEPTEILGVESMTPISCMVRTLTKTQPGQQWAVARELRKRIIVRFKLEGFSRPVQHRVVWNREWERA